MRENIGNDVLGIPELERDLKEAGIEPKTAEAERSGKVGQAHIPVPFPFPPPTDEVRIAEELRQAELVETKSLDEAIAEAKPLIEEFLNNPEITAKVNKSGYRWDLDGLSGLATPTRDPDLRDFKKQVIAAFKHLGLDTTQYFGV